MKLKTSGQQFVGGVAVFGLVLALLGVSGCASSEHRQRSESQYDQDQDLAEQIRDALQSAPVYRYPDVKVAVYRGKVQLSGFVTTEAQKKKAADIAKRVKGVARVENDLHFKQTQQNPAVGQSNPSAQTGP